MPVRIRFDRALYPESAVRSAAEAFSASLPIAIRADAQAVWATLPESGAGITQDTYDEFCNYVLAESRTAE